MIELTTYELQLTPDELERLILSLSELRFNHLLEKVTMAVNTVEGDEVNIVMQRKADDVQV
jgi:hypothetical protein